MAKKHQIGPKFLEKTAVSFEGHYRKNEDKQAKNLALFLIHMYNFDLIDCKLM